MANENPTGQASTETGKGETTPPAASTAPAAGANAEATAKPAGDGNQAAAGGGQAGGQAGTEGGKEGAQAAQPKAPEKYELVVPKGAETFIGKATLAEIESEAREQKLSNEQAQAALEAYADKVATRLEKFKTETANDATYGKDKLEANQQLARKVIDRVRPKGHPRAESFAQFLEESGATNHIEVFAFLADLGRLMAEDQPPLTTGAPTVPAKTAVEKLYGAEPAK